MKYDVLIIRLGFVILLALGGYLLDPLAKSSHVSELVGDSVKANEGRIRISDAAGLAKEVGPGEAAVIPAGFTGVFEVLEAVRKYYVVVERG